MQAKPGPMSLETLRDSAKYKKRADDFAKCDIYIYIYIYIYTREKIDVMNIYIYITNR